MGKPTQVKHVQIGDIITTHVLELLHIDLFGPTKTESVRGKNICVHVRE